MPSPRRINFIGCGRAGRALGRLWYQSGVFAPGEILTNSIASATAAVEVIGAGTAIGSIEEMQEADLVLIATPDDQIRDAARQVVGAGLINPDTIIFHLSGALTASTLGSAVGEPGYRASCHPLRSLAEPLRAAETFAGTWCGMEGDHLALETLDDAFSAVGARTFRIDSGNKLLYHAASVMATNYLNALVESSVQTFRLAGVDNDIAMQIVEQMISGTANSIFSLGARQSLTGPVSRGDDEIVSRELSALSVEDESLANVYQSLAVVAANMACGSGQLDEDGLARIRSALNVRNSQLTDT